MIKKNYLKSVLSDKTSGSSEILEKLNNYFLSNIRSAGKIKNELPEIKKTLSCFAAVSSYIKTIKKYLNADNIKGMKNFMHSFPAGKEKSYKKLYKNAEKYIAEFNTILTLSNSKTLFEVFKIWSKNNKKLKIIVCESRPKNEGVTFAKALTDSGIKTELICEALMSRYIMTSDAVIIGADAILKNGNVVNKTGSRNAAIICQYYRKPFIVFTGSDKFSGQKNFKTKKEDPNEIMKGKIKNLTVNNFYFEEVDKQLVTKICSE